MNDLPTRMLLMWSIAACGRGDSQVPDASTVDASVREVVMAPTSLLVGQLAEGILTGGPSDAAAIHLVAPNATLDWNLHGHANGGTQTIQEQLGIMTADYVFVPTSRGDWYLLLRNKDPAPMTIQVELDLFGNMQWSGWQ